MAFWMCWSLLQTENTERDPTVHLQQTHAEFTFCLFTQWLLFLGCWIWFCHKIMRHLMWKLSIPLMIVQTDQEVKSHYLQLHRTCDSFIREYIMETCLLSPDLLPRKSFVELCSFSAKLLRVMLPIVMLGFSYLFVIIHLCIRRLLCAPVSDPFCTVHGLPSAEHGNQNSR